MTGTILAIVSVVLLLFLAALLAAAETGFTRMSRARAEALGHVAEANGNGNGDDDNNLVRRLVDDRISSLAPLLLGLALCNAAVATIIAIWAYERWERTGAIVAVAVAGLVIFVFALALPKARALTDLDRVVRFAARPLAALTTLFGLRWLMVPLVRIVGRRDEPSELPSQQAPVSEEELLALTEQAAQDDAIDPDEQDMIESIIEFGDTTVEEVLVPRPDMITVAATATVHEAMQLVVGAGFSRIPVVGVDIDDIVGVVHAKDLMALQIGKDSVQSMTVDDVRREPFFVPETKRIAKLLREMQAETFHMAIVVDEYGGTAGIVTLEDLIEEVVGEIVDEFDVEEPMIEALENGEVRVNGRASLSAIENLVGEDFPEGDWSTVGGLIFSSLGHVPDVGETLDIDHHTLIVERMQGNRIARVRISRRAPQPAAPVS